MPAHKGPEGREPECLLVGEPGESEVNIAYGTVRKGWKGARQLSLHTAPGKNPKRLMHREDG